MSYTWPIYQILFIENKREDISFLSRCFENVSVLFIQAIRTLIFLKKLIVNYQQVYKEYPFL